MASDELTMTGVGRATEVAPLAAELDRLDSHLGTMREMLDRLDNRMAAVLSPNGPEGGLLKAKDGPSRAPLTERMSRMADELAVANLRLESLVQRIDL